MITSQSCLRIGVLVLLGWWVSLNPFQPAITANVSSKATDRSLRLPLRTRVEAFKGSGQWEEVQFQKDFQVSQTAILICDMWDQHWCAGATRRVDALAQKMAPLVEQARTHGIQIIHAPSEVMNFYQDTPQRRRIQELPSIKPPSSLSLTDPPLPIDDSDEGCDTPGDKPHKAWTRQHSAISIAGQDVVSDSGAEIYSLLRHQGIQNLLVMGVHTNMCVLNRTFAIKQMTRWGISCTLIRDLTDSMYNPRARPYVSHEEGTELVIQHIEKYWCPTVLSRDLLKALHKILPTENSSPGSGG